MPAASEFPSVLGSCNVNSGDANESDFRPALDLWIVLVLQKLFHLLHFLVNCAYLLNGQIEQRKLSAAEYEFSPFNLAGAACLAARWSIGTCDTCNIGELLSALCSSSVLVLRAVLAGPSALSAAGLSHMHARCKGLRCIFSASFCYMSCLFCL